MPQVDYYLTLVSPYAYMGHGQFMDVVKRHDLSVTIKPANMGDIFSKTGGLPLAKRAPARQAYRFQELKRWRQFLDIPLNLEPKFFPANDRAAAGMVIAAQQSGQDCLGLAGAILRAVWAEERDVADPDTLVSIANEQNLGGSALLDASTSPEITRIWEAYTQDALDAGVFGAPTYVYGEELFWGQDRVSFLEHAIQTST